MDTLPTYFMFLSRKSNTQPAKIQYTKIVSQRSKHSKWHWDRPQLINIEVIRGMRGMVIFYKTITGSVEKCICFWVIIFIRLVTGCWWPASQQFYISVHTHCSTATFQSASAGRPPAIGALAAGKKRDGYKKTCFLQWVWTGCRPPGPNSSQVCAVVSSGLI